MKKIDTKEWKNFLLTDLFDITGSTTTPKQKLNLSDDATYPYVTTAGTNNGICGYSEIYTELGNVLTVDSAVLGTTFYQKDNFSASDHVEKLVPKFHLTENIGNYIATILNTSAKTLGYAYNEKRSQQALKTEQIKLPVDKNGNPDWEYMESYMKNIMQESEQNIENLQNISEHKNKIDVKDWQEFLLGGENGLFNIVKGTRLTKANMKEGNINFIGSSAINNGVTNHISNSERVHPANLITVSYNGSIGEAFYQDEPFWASDDVNVFYPKFKQNFEIAMFLIPLIRKVGEKYKFVDKWTLEDMCSDKIKLPVNKNGEPDWEYMEQYMRSIIEEAQLKLNKLVSCQFSS